MFAFNRYLPYMLNRAGTRLALIFSDQALHTVTLPMWRIMACLWEEEYRCQSHLAALTDSDPATLSRLVKRMETMGLLSRKRSTRSAREVCVKLTAKGRQWTRRIIPVALTFEGVATEGIAPEQVELMRNLLIRMNENIDAYRSRLAEQAKAAARHRRQAAAAERRTPQSPTARSSAQ